MTRRTRVLLPDKQKYTYSIRNKKTGEVYYGVRYAKSCSPSDLGVSYFSSSPIILKLVAEQGVDAFEWRVRRVFSSSWEALRWEHKLLTRVRAQCNLKMYNRHNGGTMSDWLLRASPEDKLAFSEAVRKGYQSMNSKEREEHRVNVALGRIKWWRSLTAEGKMKLGQKISNGQKDMSVNGRKVRSEHTTSSLKGYYSTLNEEEWKTLSDKRRIAWTDEARRKKSEQMKERCNTPEAREKMRMMAVLSHNSINRSEFSVGRE